MKDVFYTKGQVICKENDPADEFFLIYNGKVQVYKDKKMVREMEKGVCFGEASLLVNGSRTATVIAECDSEILVLSKDNFRSITNEEMVAYLTQRLALQDSFKMKLTDFYYVKKLGAGKFGLVTLIHDNKNYYAMKLQKRKEAEKHKILTKKFATQKKD